MTSGVFRNVPVESITVPTGRQRKDFDEEALSSLADSIKRLGLIHPLLVEEDFSLVAGERRLLAVRKLGWTVVPVQLASEVTDAERRALELEENTKRQDLTWQERCNAIADYHADRIAETPTWSTDDTAAALGFDRTWVPKQLKVAEELRAGNQAVIEAPKLSTAVGLVERKREREKQSTVAALVRAVYDKPTEVFEPITVGNFFDVATSFAGEPFNLLHVDFPYGVRSNENQQGYAVEEHGGYEDTPELFFALLDTFVTNCDRFAAESCHLMFWFSMKYYTETLAMLRRTRFIVDDFPLIWQKDIGLLPDPNRGPRRVYETAFFGRAGDRKVVRAVANAVSLPRGDGHIHMSVKPVPVLNHFFRMLVDGTTTLFDPTAGGGTALQAALGLGARSVHGIEINPDFARRANEALTLQRKEVEDARRIAEKFAPENSAGG